jgi:hypothetical protein
MTLRQYLRRRSAKVVIPGGVVIVAVSMLVGIYVPRESLWKELPVYLSLLFMAGFMVYLLRVRCPRCHAWLGYIICGLRRHQIPQSTLNYCTSCSLQLDEEIPESAPGHRA